MFVCTLRKGGLRKLAVVAVCGVVLAGAAITVGVVRNKGDAVDAAAQGGALSQQITGAQDVATFLQGYGVEVDPTTAEVSTVTVPRKWDDNFKAFNEVIKESGLDLSRVKNKKVDKWVVLIPAQSTETQKSYGVVLVYKNEARGAYILQKPSGEVLPLKAAAPTGASLALTDEEVAANAGFGAAFPADDSAAAAAAGAGVSGANAAADAQAGADTVGPTEDAAAEAQAQADADAQIEPGAFPTE